MRRAAASNSDRSRWLRLLEEGGVRAPIFWHAVIHCAARARSRVQANRLVFLVLVCSSCRLCVCDWCPSCVREVFGARYVVVMAAGQAQHS